MFDMLVWKGQILTWLYSANVEAEWTEGLFIASFLLSFYLTAALLSLQLPFEVREVANSTKMDWLTNSWRLWYLPKSTFYSSEKGK